LIKQVLYIFISPFGRGFKNNIEKNKWYYKRNYRAGAFVRALPGPVSVPLCHGCAHSESRSVHMCEDNTNRMVRSLYYEY